MWSLPPGLMRSRGIAQIPIAIVPLQGKVQALCERDVGVASGLIRVCFHYMTLLSLQEKDLCEISANPIKSCQAKSNQRNPGACIQKQGNSSTQLGPDTETSVMTQPFHTQSPLNEPVRGIESAEIQKQDQQQANISAVQFFNHHTAVCISGHGNNRAT